ncbi:secretin and TonB N-terminal domain-containing protein, partial [Desulfonatronospira sp.]|uniref:secretin and TonB N-terminal domain-containing protein n=1 Tax=Desulfonatronospira sp. TaxID=1962951 RepID=UPI0025C5B587
MKVNLTALLLTLLLIFLGAYPGTVFCRDISSARQSPGSEGQGYLEEIDFWMDQHDALHVQLLGQGPFDPSVKSRDSGRMHTLLPEVSTAPGLVRLYRLDELNSPLKSVLLRNTDDGTLLTWVWSREPVVHVKNTHEELTFRFTDNSGEVPDGSSRTLLSPSTQEMGQPDQQGPLAREQQKYSGDPISIDLQNAEIEHVLRLITHHTEYNMVLDEDVRGKISLRLHDVPWDQALVIVLDQKDLGREIIDNIIRVTTAEKLQAQRQRALEERESLRALEPVLQEYFQINYAKA